MRLTYRCKNLKCNYPKEMPYEVNFESEAIMDEKNLAIFFCPHCNEKLKAVEDLKTS